LERQIHGQQQPGFERCLYRVWDKVPCINREENCFQSNADGVMLIGHYLQAFCEVSINTLNQHGVMVITRKNMAVDVQ
jgi:hypothetical protein